MGNKELWTIEKCVEFANRFKSIKLIKKQGIVVKNGINNYGMIIKETKK